MEPSNNFAASKFAESEISLFVWIPQDYSEKCVLEVEREGALEIEIECTLEIGRETGFLTCRVRSSKSEPYHTKKLRVSPEAVGKGKVS